RPHRCAENRRQVHGGQDPHRRADHPPHAAGARRRGRRPDARGQVEPFGGGLLMTLATGATAAHAHADAVPRLPLRRSRDGDWQEAMDDVAAEVPVALSYNSIPHVVMMATPRDLPDMGVGFTVSEALASAEEIRDVQLDTSSGAFELRLSVTGSRLGEML